ncbi:MAG: hypothetical protein ACK2UO_21095 [Caldilineaceae bacterium]
MTAESERGTSETGVDRKSTTTPMDSLEHFMDSPVEPFLHAQEGSSADESAEDLRYRADSLLDEMMLSAVDVSAADYGAMAGSGDGFDGDPGPFDADDGYGGDTYGAGDYVSGSYTSPESHDPDPHSNNGDAEHGASHRSKSHETNLYESDPYGAGRSAAAPYGTSGQNGSGHAYGQNGGDSARSQNGGRDAAFGGSNGEASHHEPGSSGPYGSGNGATMRPNGTGAHSSDHASDDGANLNSRDAGETVAQPTPEWRVMTGGGGDNETTAWNDYVTSFRSPGSSSAQIQKWQPNFAVDGFTSSEPDPRSDRPGTDTGSNAHQGQASAAQESPVYANREREEESLNTQGTGYVSAMAVMPKGPRRSALLPRMSRFDVDALNREIAELHEEIRSLLPIGHDQSERAQHLLDKAHTIANSDPQRSAEVEYYMQQVRSIVERTRDSRRWSNLYRDRLRVYLLAWALLSVLTLTALWLSQFQIEAFVSGLLGSAPGGMFMRNFAGALGSIMAGALGSALGCLINMRKHSRSQYGFFDRKYGLRGLTLPIIGSIVGMLIYALFAIVYLFLGINPSLSVLAMATPALLAFIFGYSQESLYGTSS